MAYKMREKTIAWYRSQCAGISAEARSSDSNLTTFAKSGAQSALETVESRIEGLSHTEAEERLKIHGANVLSSAKPPTWRKTLLLTIPNPFNILLFCLAIIAIATPDRDLETFFILLIMIAVSCAVKFYQEYRSGRAAVELRNSLKSEVQVLRLIPANADVSSSEKASADSDRSVMSIPETEVVPGDILVLRPGDKVPADGLLLEESYLHISQSSLSGESEAMRKSATPKKTTSSILELDNIVFMGTSVVSGSGLVLVLYTGDNSYMATLVKEINKAKPTNAFQTGIRNVSYMLIGFMVVMVPIVLGISGRVTGNWADAAMFSVSVAVGLVPEMLPAVVTANLARGAYVLAKKKAIIKRLDSIQNLGAMSVLCSDKTGTLTKDDVTLCDHLSWAGTTNPSVLSLAHINAASQTAGGSSIDKAILKFARETTGLETPTYAKVDEIPFTFERRRASCIVRSPELGLRLICKGAVEETSVLCTHVRECDGLAVFNDSKIQQLTTKVQHLNSEGYRVILVASKTLPEDFQNDTDEPIEALEESLTLEGFLLFFDPPKDDARSSVEELQKLGVEVKIITGDSLMVALRTCRLLNLVSEVSEDGLQAITGSELEKLTGTDRFDEAVKSCRVFAKVSPIQKGEIVMSLKAAGHCVGMLGDGANDSIALRYADVGISVESGAGIATDASDVVMTQKELSIMTDCVRIGRVTHGNTLKYIKMVASSNFGNVFSVLVASAWLPFQPMLGVQLLVQNLLYDISQIAIPWDHMDEEYLLQPKKWSAKDLLRFILVLGPTSSTIDITTFLINWFYYGVKSAANAQAVSLFHTHWFLQGLLTQTLIVHMLRTPKIPFIRSIAAKPLLCSTALIMAIGLAIPYIPPFQRSLDFVQPASTFIGILFAELVVYCLEVQLVKAVYIKLFKAWL